MGPFFWMAAMALLTDSSESTSIVEMVMGSFSCAAVSAKAGDCDGLRMVAVHLMASAGEGERGFQTNSLATSGNEY